MAVFRAVITLTLANEDPHPVRSFPLTSDDPPFPVGRASGSVKKNCSGPSPNNAFFDSVVISRNHAEFTLSPLTGELRIRDVGSMHGTTVNHDKMKPPETKVIHQGDLVELGSSVYENGIQHRTRQFYVTRVINRLPPAPSKPEVIDLSSPPRTPIALTNCARMPFPNVYTVPDSSSDSEEYDSDDSCVRIVQDPALRSQSKVFAGSAGSTSAPIEPIFNADEAPSSQVSGSSDLSGKSSPVRNLSSVYIPVVIEQNAATTKSQETQARTYSPSPSSAYMIGDETISDSDEDFEQDEDYDDGDDMSDDFDGSNIEENQVEDTLSISDRRSSSGSELTRPHMISNCRDESVLASPTVHKSSDVAIVENSTFAPPTAKRVRGLTEADGNNSTEVSEKAATVVSLSSKHETTNASSSAATTITTDETIQSNHASLVPAIQRSATVQVPPWSAKTTEDVARPAVCDGPIRAPLPVSKPPYSHCYTGWSNTAEPYARPYNSMAKGWLYPSAYNPPHQQAINPPIPGLAQSYCYTDKRVDNFPSLFSPASTENLATNTSPARLPCDNMAGRSDVLQLAQSRLPSDQERRNGEGRTETASKVSIQNIVAPLSSRKSHPDSTDKVPTDDSSTESTASSLIAKRREEPEIAKAQLPSPKKARTLPPILTPAEQHLSHVIDAKRWPHLSEAQRQRRSMLSQQQGQNDTHSTATQSPALALPEGPPERKTDGAIVNEQASQSGSTRKVWPARDPLGDFQMQLMLLEQQNKKRLMIARQARDTETGGSLKADNAIKQNAQIAEPTTNTELGNVAPCDVTASEQQSHSDDAPVNCDADMSCIFESFDFDSFLNEWSPTDQPATSKLAQAPTERSTTSSIQAQAGSSIVENQHSLSTKATSMPLLSASISDSEPQVYKEQAAPELDTNASKTPNAQTATESVRGQPRSAIVSAARSKSLSNPIASTLSNARARRHAPRQDLTKEYSGLGSKVTPFMLGALMGGIGVFGALVGLPDSYF